MLTQVRCDRILMIQLDATGLQGNSRSKNSSYRKVVKVHYLETIDVDHSNQLEHTDNIASSGSSQWPVCDVTGFVLPP